MSRVVVVGGVAAGMSAASQAKRRDRSAEVVVLERGPHVSYGACGLPYNIEDPTRPIEDLIVFTPERFARERQVEVRTGHEALRIDAVHKQVRVRDLAEGREYDVPYDKLVLATGASAVKLKVPGMDLEGVFVLRELTDGARLKSYLETRRPQRAVVIGAGYIGMEMVEVLRSRKLEVTLLERMPQVVPGFEPEIAQLVQAELVRCGVRVETGVSMTSVEPGPKGGLVVRTERSAIACDLVLVAVGVRPNVALAEAAGVRLGETGAIAVDAHQRTNVPDIYAAGDCAEALHLVSGRPTWVPLGTTANKQGKVAGAHAVGGEASFGGIVGTAAFKVFDLEVARTGLGRAELERLQWSAISSVSRQANRANSYPGGSTLTTVLFVERESGRLLGAQMCGASGVAKRIDVFATALHARMDVRAIEGLDLAYAPPFAPVYDPVLIAATVAQKDLAKG